MQTIMRKNNIAWVDLESPTKEELRQLIETYNIPVSIGDDLFGQSPRPKVDLYKNCIYLILHFPSKNTEAGRDELDIVIGKNFLITSRYGALDALHEFAKLFEVSTILDYGDMGEHAGYLFFHLMRHLYRRLHEEVETTSATLDDIESNIFKGREKAMVYEISRASRRFLNYKRTLRLHKEVLKSLEVAGVTFFGESFAYHLKAIRNEYEKINAVVESTLELLSELRATNDSLVSTEQNEVMKTVTILAFIMLPLGIISSLLQIDAIGNRIVGTVTDLRFVFAIMIASVAILFGFFKYKKWL